MAERNEEQEPRPPLMQTVFDNVFLLLVLGLAVPVILAPLPTGRGPRARPTRRWCESRSST